ncbi:helix-turn-helix domain-containing protein [Streptomyces sp. NPDC012421]|uniref:helix-turn-helix domain-containing protein n=1 Tax=Streptomyces sp. NPDC012421 TaxID=3364832 RepID=UPI0036E81EEB
MLAELLRAERDRAGSPTYEQMAAASEVSAATLKRAASGRSTPSEKTVNAYLLACGSGVSTRERALIWRLKARRDERGGRRKVYVEGISTPSALLDGLAALHVNLGARPYEEMQKRAGGAPMLPLSSISRILNREMLPVDEKQMAAFIQGCGVLNRDREKWMQAWRRVKGVERRPSRPPEPRLLQLLEQRAERDLWHEGAPGDRRAALRHARRPAGGSAQGVLEVCRG